MTPERIAEIEELAATKAPMVYVRAGSIRELCRLARLGLRVESAPVADPFPAMGLVDQHLLTGKRVALVVME